MQRVCFELQIKPQRLEEYVERHRTVWPDMLTALASTGWHNYSLFLRDDGLLIGYFETPSFEQAVAGMEATDVNARWQAEMAEYFEGNGAFIQLREVFHLEDQLAQLSNETSE